ncbi:metal ABC transporter ATP-binding protein [Kineothrix sp. MB12-C1]|uniref:metal ABC transporter ATP-binding protein n=1 Tax=Kineothrix sp. MB12-C1 TaxID=3070215 RepID=UPI0027D28BF4|nr:metal ABC transporter ATP-binding protein [Kineothrix sp. MB12-C1]WMC94497.1 metal ABC transporter ATP-binding protein [Kineothrix sp. MB12-C1]
MALITCQNAAFAYDGNIVVEGLNFTVNSGDYLCIVGENGSGKSTLIKGLLQLKQPYKGELSLNEELKANEIGYLPQQTAAQKDFPASVYEVVLSGRLSMRGILPFYTKKDKEAAEENLNRLGIQNLRNKCYRELSGGQQQRTLLARALCATQKILLLDEPVSGLDPIVTQELYTLIAKINEELGITIIMVSHDIHSAVKYAGNILHLKNEQVFFGTTEEYIQSNAGVDFLGGTQK